MPTTPVYALRYPALTDPADVPTDMGELATDVEAALQSKGPGAELAYAQIVANVTVSGASEAAGTPVVAAPAVTFDGSPVIIEFAAPAFATALEANSGVIVTLWDGGTALGHLLQVSNPGAGAIMNVGLHASRRLSPSAGSHSYAIKAWKLGPTNVTIYAAAGGAGVYSPAFIRITRA